MNINDVVIGKITKIQKTHFFVELDDNYKGMVHISSASDYFIGSLSSMFKINSEYNFKIIEVDNASKRVKLDWKSIHPRFQKNPFKYGIKETVNGYSNLKSNMEKEVENDQS